MNNDREAFKAWFKKEYLGIDDLANQGDGVAKAHRAYAYVGYQAAKAESHKQVALYQFEINHLAQANEQWREKAANAQAMSETQQAVIDELKAQLKAVHDSRVEFVEYCRMVEAQENKR